LVEAVNQIADFGCAGERVERHVDGAPRKQPIKSAVALKSMTVDNRPCEVEGADSRPLKSGESSACLV
jgi:hypothetical protein